MFGGQQQQGTGMFQLQTPQLQQQPLQMQPQVQQPQQQNTIGQQPQQQQQQQIPPQQQSSTFNIKQVLQDQKKKFTKAEQIIKLSEDTKYLKNRVKYRFNPTLDIKRTQNSIIDDIGNRVNLLLNRFNLGLRNIDYQSDQLSRLSERIKQDQANQEKNYRSKLKIDNMQLCTLDEYIHKREETQQNYIYFKSLSQNERQFHNKLEIQIENILSQSAQNRIRSPEKILLISKFIPHSDAALDNIFIKSKLHERLALYNQVHKDRSHSSGTNIIETIFQSLSQCQSNYQSEIKLLEAQFTGIPVEGLSIEECQEKIIRNTVQYLEKQMLQNIGTLEFANLNKKFKEIYLENLRKQMTIKQYGGQTFPTGVLFLLMRCGKLELSKSILEPYLNSNDSQQLAYFISLISQQEFTQQEVEQIRNQGVSDDLLMQQFLLLLDLSDLDEVFYSKFDKDKDLLLWITLKTCHANPNHVEYAAPDEPKKLYQHMTLTDLNECIPQDIGLNINLMLQRYEEALAHLVNSPNVVEYFILYIITRDLGFTSRDIGEKEIGQLNNLITQLFARNPITGVLVCQLAFKGNDALIIQTLAEQLINPNLLQNLMTDRKFKNDLNQILSASISDITIRNTTMNMYLRVNSHKYFEEFISSLQQGNSITNYHDYFNQLAHQLEEVGSKLKLLQQYKDKESCETLVNSYFDLSFIILFSQTLINIDLQNKCKVKKLCQFKFQSQILNELPAMISVELAQQDIHKTGIFLLIQAFNELQLMITRGKFDETRIQNLVIKINVYDLTDYLHSLCQEQLIQMFFWTLINAKQQDGRTEKPVYLQQAIRQMTEALRNNKRKVRSQKQKAFKEELETHQLEDKLIKYSEFLLNY